MTRLRFTRTEAETQAKRLASDFVSGLPWASSYRCVHAHPDTTVPKSGASKHPVAWVVMFKSPDPPGVVVDGGELFVTVNVETNAVAIAEW